MPYPQGGPTKVIHYLGKFRTDDEVNQQIAEYGWRAEYERTQGEVRRYYVPEQGLLYWNTTVSELRMYIGTTWQALPGAGGGGLTVEDEGVVVDAAATVMDFVGAGVTATQTAPGQVQVTIPGAAGAAVFEVDLANNEIQPVLADKGRSFVVGSQSTEDTGAPADDARMFFSKSDGAFRAGRVDAAQWDAASRGQDSVAFGFKTIAAGAYSSAEGYDSDANDTADHAEGYASWADGPGAHAECWNTRATGQGSHSEGYGSQATARAAHSEGIASQAQSDASHAEGYRTTATGQYSHSEGWYSWCNVNAHSGHAEGNYGQAQNRGAHAEGSYTIASGYASHAEGDDTRASGAASHAEGDTTQASAASAHAEGDNTTATQTSAHAEGTSTSAQAAAAHAEGNSTIASAANAHAEGLQTTASQVAAHSEGYETVASGRYSHAEGQGSRATQRAAHAEGYYCQANGTWGSHAEGYQTTASGSYSHAEGENTQATTYAAHAEGSGTIANRDYSHAEGEGTYANAIAGHSEGIDTIVDTQAQGGHAEGWGSRSYFRAHHAHSCRSFSRQGDGQYSRVTVGRVTTVTGWNPLSLDYVGYNVLTALVLPNVDTVWEFEVKIVAREVGVSDDCAAFSIQGCIKRTAGGVAFVGAASPINAAVIGADAGAGTWRARATTATLGGVSNALGIEVDSNNDNRTIRWLASVKLTEVAEQ